VTESQATAGATVSILEVPSSTVSRRFYKIVARNAAGEPARGVEASISKTGDGSFAPNFRSDDIKRVTGENGESDAFIWYRNGVYLRNAKSTITATGPDGVTVEIVETENPQGEYGVSYVERPITLPPKRV
jgi:hypothetical protein